jgi:putative phage-type endonuclease
MLFGYQLPELKNIINLFRWKNILTIEETDEIELSMGTLIDNFIEGDVLGFSNPYFELNLKEYVFKNMLLSLGEVFCLNNSCSSDRKETVNINIPLKTQLEEELENIYLKIHKYYFTKYYPPRSYADSFIRVEPNIEQMSIKIKYIENKPQPEQRTTEWYEFRYNLITASSAWKAFKSQATMNQLIVEKCKDLNVSKYDTVNTATPMHHGNKYEDVSIMLYESMYNTKVKDYGCIQHDTFKFLGASPDGINVDASSSRYGRMLEIKNPTTRAITGVPKEDYWIQMQLQMETCNLNECDFLETVFKEYDSEEDFMNDGTFTHTEEGQIKGMIVYFMKDGKPFYEYMPLYYSKDHRDIWYDEIMSKNNDLTWIKDIYWWLDEYSCVLVLRNKLWFENAISKIQDIWTIIEKERKTGHEHRLPKKQNRGSRSNSLVDATNNNVSGNIDTSNTGNRCLINVDNL